MNADLTHTTSADSGDAPSDRAMSIQPIAPGRRIARMFAQRRTSRAWSPQQVADAANQFAPPIPIRAEDCLAVESDPAHGRVLGGVVMPIGRALGFTKREVNLAWKLDAAQRAMQQAESIRSSPRRVAFTICRFADRPGGMISALGRSKVEHGLAKRQTIPAELEESGDVRELLSWAAEVCLTGDVYGWLEWNRMLRFRIAPDGRVEPEFAPLDGGGERSYPTWVGA